MEGWSEAIEGDYAYIASAKRDALETLDIFNQSYPRHIGALLDGGRSALFLNQPVSVFVANNIAYVGSIEFGMMEANDVSDPATPTHLGSITLGGGTLPYASARPYDLAVS